MDPAGESKMNPIEQIQNKVLRFKPLALVVVAGAAIGWIGTVLDGFEKTHRFYCQTTGWCAARQITLGSCVGGGGLIGQRFWGPAGQYCNGLKEWGRYDAQVRKVSVLGSCVGHGGLGDLKFYGPVGEPCVGVPEWGTYEGTTDVSTTGIAACKGHGSKIGGQLLWGPRDAFCAGVPTFGKFDQDAQQAE
jgi:hypothetical protein